MEHCTCELAGWCERHKIQKTEHLRKLCQSREDYRRAWDAGNGPMQGGTGPASSVVATVAYNHWVPLHNYAAKHADNWSEAKAKAFYRRWQRAIPNKGCGCRAKWKKLGQVPDYSSAKAFFVWAWRAHNTVNQSIERPKPTITLCEAYSVWWPSRLIDSSNAAASSSNPPSIS